MCVFVYVLCRFYLMIEWLLNQTNLKTRRRVLCIRFWLNIQRTVLQFYIRIFCSLLLYIRLISLSNNIYMYILLLLGCWWSFSWFIHFNNFIVHAKEAEKKEKRFKSKMFFYRQFAPSLFHFCRRSNYNKKEKNSNSFSLR